MQENNFNKNDLENELLNKLLDENKNFTTSKILEHVINMLMRAERKIHLQENDNDKLTLLKSSPTHEQAVDDFKKLLSDYKDKYPHFVKYTISRAEYYFNFTHLPLDVRKYFYTTNAVESFNSIINSIIEKKRNLAGGFFQSMEYLKVNVYLHYLRLKSKKWAKSTPFIKANLYSFNQLFATRFNRSPYLKTQYS